MFSFKTNKKLVKTLLKNKSNQFKILIGLMIITFSLINLIQLLQKINGQKSLIFPPLHSLIILIILIFLEWLSLKKHFKAAAWLILATLSIISLHLLIWTKVSPEIVFLLAILIIILSGALINNRYILITGGLSGLSIIFLNYWQSWQQQLMNIKFSNDVTTLNDFTIYTLLILTIAWAIWILIYKVYHYSTTAQTSKESLINSLFLKKQIKTAKGEYFLLEKEKMIQLHRLSNFGRLSAGVFHDLINPLTAISLGLEQINAQSKFDFKQNQKQLKIFLQTSKQIQSIINAIKRQLQGGNEKIFFLANKEMNQIIQILSFKARKIGSKINYSCSDKKIKIYGDPNKFSQIISNILSNALDAVQDKLKQNPQNKENNNKVEIKLMNQLNKVVIKVEDQGIGIKQSYLDKIFNPFFSTKKGKDSGLGLGLFSVKNSIRKNFKGQIKVSSQENKGTCFTIFLPTN